VTPREILVAAREYLDDPDHWCQGTGYRDPSTGYKLTEGRAFNLFDEGKSIQVCLSTSLVLFGRHDQGARREARRALRIATPDGYPDAPSFNDYYKTTHKDVTDLLDRAIERTDP
jgi:hypothetical protein